MNTRVLIVMVIMIFVLAGCFSFNKKGEVPENEVVKEETVQQENEASDTDEGSELAELEDVVKDSVAENDIAHSEPKATVEDEQNQTNIEQTSTNDAAEEKVSEGSKQSIENKNNNSDSVAPAVMVSEEEIKQKYQQKLLNLQSYYVGKVEGLYSGSISELKNANGDKKAIYTKYFGMGMALQEESDAKVNQTLYQMEKELKDNDLPTTSVSEFRQTYHSELARARNGAFDKIKKELGI